MALRYPSGTFSARGKRGTGRHKPKLYRWDGGEDYKQRRTGKVDTPSGRASFARASQAAALKVAAVIYEEVLVICLHNF
jgi:hypothetical protein